MMNKNQGIGIVERVLYGAVAVLVMKLGPHVGLTEADIPWIVGGMIALGGGTAEWLRNRPVPSLNRASDVIPKDAKLVIATPASAPPVEHQKAAELATAANDKVVARLG